MSEKDTIYEADYTQDCDNCGNSPTVLRMNKATGDVECDFGMCGPCTFGSAECIDPEEW